jgi:integrase
MFDEATEIPHNGLLGKSSRRIQPHIFSDKEISLLMKAAGELSPVDGIRPRTYKALFGILASTGLRITEAIRLRRADLDLEKGVLQIVESKFRKSRLVVIHPTTSIQLHAYAHFRDQYHYPARDPDAFFLSERGKPLNYAMAEHAFRGISRQLGWDTSTDQPRPRLYDFRHTFACRRLLQWYKDGTDVEHAIASLSTYMGHECLRDTYWYLTGIPELLHIVTKRFECFAKKHHQEALS